MPKLLTNSNVYQNFARSILFTTLILTWVGWGIADTFHSPFEIEIKISKKEYKLAETLQGEINIDNQYPVTLPATFDMKLYRNGKFVRDAQVYLKGFPSGPMSFDLKTFSLPTHPFTRKDLGKWEIVINQLNADAEFAAHAQFAVVEKVVRSPDYSVSGKSK